MARRHDDRNRIGRFARVICTSGLLACACGIGHAQTAPATAITFRSSDGGLVHADVYGTGPRGIVLAHGGRFNKSSWEKQSRELMAAGYRVVALDFRGYGKSTGPGQGDVFTAPLHLDVLAAVTYLRSTGAATVAAIGGSLGGGAAARATIASPGAIDRLILLGSTPHDPAQRLTVRKLYIATRDDASGAGPRLPGLQAHFDAAPQPKELILLEGDAHAQFMFDTDLAERVMRDILRFLAE